MPRLIALVVIASFALLALIHAYWALGGRAGSNAAVPEVDQRPAFVPSASGTFTVAVGLAACAALVAASAGFIISAIPSPWITWLAYALAVALLARAVGDFRMVGFFKRIRGTRFSRLDSAVYAPLCLALAVAVFYVAIVHRG
jgi:hypothetical protein